MSNNNRVLSFNENFVNYKLICINYLSKCLSNIILFCKNYWIGIIIGVLSNIISIGIVISILEIYKNNKININIYYDHILCFFINIINTIIFYVICKNRQIKVENENNILENSLCETSRKLIDIKRETFARIAHDLRTPMQIINGSILILKGELPGNSEQAIEDIEKFSELSEKIINNFLKLERSLSLGDENIFNFKPIVLKSFFDIIGSGFKTKISNESKNIEIIIDNRLEDDATFLIDEIYFYEIFQNFISNSIKFTDKGHIIILIKDITNKLNDTIINVESTRDALEDYSIVQFKIKDTGIGMNLKQIAGLFKEYNRVHYSSHGNIPGTGLGLCIAKQYIRLINKNSKIINPLIDLERPIVVSSIYENGSTFTFNIVLFKAEKKDLSKINTISEIDLDNKDKEIDLSRYNLKILIVEDSMIISRLNGQYLNKLGITQIDYANNGLEALNLLKKTTNKYNMILMDGNMPIMDGYETTYQIKNNLKIDTPIIFCTGDGLDNEIQKALNAGATDHLIKPFTIKEMGHILLKYLN